MQIVPTYPNGEPIDPEYTKYHRYFNGTELIVFDDFAEYAEYFGLNNPPEPSPVYEWNVPSNATIVPHKQYGLPVDDIWLNYPRFFRGDVLFVFNTVEEFDQYIAERTDFKER
jgi:hypothetical protein